MKQTMGTLLQTLNLPEDLQIEDFDPEKHVGDVRDKLDAIKAQMISWEKEAEKLEAWYKPFEAMAKSYRKASVGLNTYLKIKMIENGFDKVPGNKWQAVLQKSANTLKIDLEEPSPLHFLNEEFRPFVTQQVVYKWNKDAIEEALISQKNLSFARLVPGKSLYIRPIKEINT